MRPRTVGSIPLRTFCFVVTSHKFWRYSSEPSRCDSPPVLTHGSSSGKPLKEAPLSSRDRWRSRAEPVDSKILNSNDAGLVRRVSVCVRGTHYFTSSSLNCSHCTQWSMDWFVLFLCLMGSLTEALDLCLFFFFLFHITLHCWHVIGWMSRCTDVS